MLEKDYYVHLHDTALLLSVVCISKVVAAQWRKIILYNSS